MATDYETLLQDVRELRVQLAHKTTLVESLTAEVLRLRRWTFGRSAEKVDLAIAPELPLEGAATASVEAAAAAGLKNSKHHHPLGHKQARMSGEPVTEIIVC